MIQIKRDELVIRIRSTSPTEDWLAYTRAIINSMRCQREDNLPKDISDQNGYLLDLLNAMLPPEQCLQDCG